MMPNQASIGNKALNPQLGTRNRSLTDGLVIYPGHPISLIYIDSWPLRGYPSRTSTENNHHTYPQSYLPSCFNSPSATIYHVRNTLVADTFYSFVQLYTSRTA